MFRKYLFAAITQLLGSQWTKGYREYHTSAEIVCAGRIGPLWLEINDCFVLDHRDAYLALRLDQIEFGYRVCLGEETVRSSGFYLSNGR
jgi:hypothetical protein